MCCSSWLVPSVVVTSACVSPRVNSAEPCVRGSTPTSQVMARMSLGGAAVDAAAGGQHQLAQVLLLGRFVRLADLGAAIGERRSRAPPWSRAPAESSAA